MGREPRLNESAAATEFARRLAQQTALAAFGQSALNASAAEPLRAEATALVERFAAGASELPSGADVDDAGFLATVAEMLEAAIGNLRAAAASHHAALHDPLTGLANRSLIVDHLHLALARAARRATLAAVLFVDLDDFKRVNDTRGHAAGDEVLVGVAERLRATVRPGDTLGRWGGDEFVVVCEDLERASDASALVGRVAAALNLPFDVSGVPLQLTASIGVALSGGDNDQPATLIHAADVAMYRAKRSPLVEEQAGPWTRTFPSSDRRPKLERVTDRLHEVLDSVVVDEIALH